MEHGILEERKRVLRIILREFDRMPPEELVASLLTRIMNDVIYECADPPSSPEELLSLFAQPPTPERESEIE